MPDGETRDIGGHVLQWFDTPHLPHGWEAGVLYDTTTKTLFCGDLFTQLGAYEPTSDADTVGPAAAAEDIFHSMSLAPDSAPRIRRLAELDVTTLALMHGPAFTGDCRAALLDLADNYATMVKAVA
jgi:flavorubredoxin